MRLPEGRRATVMLCSVAALPFIVSGLCAVVRGWAPSWDTAFVQMRVLDVGSRHTPLVGLPSTVSQAAGTEIHHPGPLHFWLLAVPEVVLRLSRSGLALAQALVNASLAVVSVVAARHAAGLRAAGVITGGWLVAAWAIGDEPLHDPWNPHFAMIALLACAVCTVAFVHRRAPWVGAAVVVTASCAAQTHLVALVPAVALVVLAAAVLLRAEGRRGAWPCARVALVAGLVAWIGPLVDQAVHSPGNLRSLLGGAGDTDAPYGPVHGFDRFSRVLVPPGLLADGVPSAVHGVHRAAEWLIALGLLALVAWAWGRRRAAGRATALHLVALVLAATTWVGQVITPDSYSSAFGRHIWTLMWPGVLLVWAAVAITIVDAVRTAGLPSAVRRPVVWLAALPALVVVTTATTITSPLTEQRDGAWFDLITNASAAVHVEDLGGAVVIRGDGFTPESQLLAGIAADLMRQGVDVRLAGPISAGLANPVHLGDDGAALLLVVAGDAPPPDGAVEQLSRPLLITPDGESVHVYLVARR